MISMPIKRIVFKVGADLLEEAREAFLNPSKRMPDTHVEIIKDEKQLAAALAPERIRLLLEILNHEEERSVSELSKKLKRKQTAVSRDLSLLEHYHLIEKTKKRQTVYPKAVYGAITIELKRDLNRKKSGR